jgi:Fic/DOC family protein
VIDTKTLQIVRFCSIECNLQQSGECSVDWMVQAWNHAAIVGLPLTVEYIEDVGRIVEPTVNAVGFRQCGVRVGSDVKLDWHGVPAAMSDLVDAQTVLTPEEWFREFEHIHPFRDGNGRTGQIFYNLLNGTLDAPMWAPNYWLDSRRQPNAGAPA